MHVQGCILTFCLQFTVGVLCVSSPNIIVCKLLAVNEIEVCLLTHICTHFLVKITYQVEKKERIIN